MKTFTVTLRVKQTFKISLWLQELFIEYKDRKDLEGRSPACDGEARLHWSSIFTGKIENLKNNLEKLFCRV